MPLARLLVILSNLIISPTSRMAYPPSIGKYQDRFLTSITPANVNRDGVAVKPQRQQTRQLILGRGRGPSRTGASSVDISAGRTESSGSTPSVPGEPRTP